MSYDYVCDFLNENWIDLYTHPSKKNMLRTFLNISHHFKPYLTSYDNYPYIMVNCPWHNTFIPMIKVCNSRIIFKNKKLLFTRDGFHFNSVTATAMLNMINLLLWGFSLLTNNHFGLFMAEWNFVMTLEDNHASINDIKRNVLNFLWHNVPYHVYRTVSVFHRPCNYYLYGYMKHLTVSDEYQRNMLNIIAFHQWHDYLKYLINSNSITK